MNIRFVLAAGVINYKRLLFKIDTKEPLSGKLKGIRKIKQIRISVILKTIGGAKHHNPLQI